MKILTVLGETFGQPASSLGHAFDAVRETGIASFLAQGAQPISRPASEGCRRVPGERGTLEPRFSSQSRSALSKNIPDKQLMGIWAAQL